MFWNISSFLPHPLLVLPFIWSPGLFQVCYLRSRDQGDTPGLSMAVAFLSSCPSLQVSFLLLWWNSPAKSDLGLFTTPGQSPPLKASLLSFHTAVPFFPSQKHSRNRRKCRLLLGLRASGVSSVWAFLRFRTILLGMVTPTVGWDLLHQSIIKTISPAPHWYAHTAIWSSQHLRWSSSLRWF